MRLLLWAILVISTTLLSSTKAASSDEKKAVLDSDSGILSHEFAENKEKRFLRAEIKKSVSDAVGKPDTDEESRSLGLSTLSNKWDNIRTLVLSRRDKKLHKQGKVADVRAAENQFVSATLNHPNLEKGGFKKWAQWVESGKKRSVNVPATH